MNKAQIGYLERRIDALKNIHMRGLRDLQDQRRLPDLPLEGRVASVLNGSAISRTDEMIEEFQKSGVNCQSKVVDFFNKFFYYPEKDLIDSKNAEVSAKYESAVKDLKKLAATLLDQFVIAGKDSEELLQSFKNLNLKELFEKGK